MSFGIRLGAIWNSFWSCFGLEIRVDFGGPFFMVSGSGSELILVPFWSPKLTSEGFRREKADLRF